MNINALSRGLCASIILLIAASGSAFAEDSLTPITQDTIADIHVGHHIQMDGVDGKHARPLEFAFDRAGNLAANYDNGVVAVWSANDGTILRQFAPECDECADYCALGQLAYTADGRLLAGNQSNGFFDIVWIVDTEAESFRDPIAVSEHKYDRVNDVAFSPDGKLLAIAVESDLGENPVIIWDVEAGKVFKTAYNLLPVTTLAFSPDGKFLATSGGDLLEGTALPISVYDVAAGEYNKPLYTFSTRGGPTINVIAFSPDSKFIVSGTGHEFSDDFALTVWKIGRDKPAAELYIPQDYDTAPDFWGGIQSFAFSPDGSTLAVGIYSNVILAYPFDSLLQHKDQPVRLNAQTGHALAFNFDGTILASADADRGISLWMAG